MQEMHKPSPRISVVIPFLDAAPYLLQAADSVFRQTLKNWELILVDGGSRDGSEELARTLARAHPKRVRVLRHKGRRPLGIFQSRLWGARRARAPLIALLDSDDELHPRLLERREAAYRRAFGAAPGLVFGPGIFWWDMSAAKPKLALQQTPRAGLHRAPELLADFLEAGYVKTPCTTGSLLARSIILKSERNANLGGRHMIEDQYLWSEVVLRYPVYVSRRPLFWYRQRADSTCALGMKRGEFKALRLRHHRWLLARVQGSGSVGRRRRLARIVRESLAR